MRSTPDEQQHRAARVDAMAGAKRSPVAMLEPILRQARGQYLDASLNAIGAQRIVHGLRRGDHHIEFIALRAAEAAGQGTGEAARQ